MFDAKKIYFIIMYKYINCFLRFRIIYEYNNKGCVLFLFLSPQNIVPCTLKPCLSSILISNENKEILLISSLNYQ